MMLSPTNVKSVPPGSEKGIGLRSATSPTAGCRRDAVI